MRVIIYILATLLSILSVYAQDFIFDQSYANRLLMNPAYCGYDGGGKYRFSSFVQKQFVRNRGEFNNASVSIDYGLCRLPLSLGFIAQSYSQGDGMLTSSSASFLIGYSVGQNNWELNSGGQFSYINSRVSWDKFVFSDQLDPIHGIVNVSSNSNAFIPNQSNIGLAGGLNFRKWSKRGIFNVGMSYNNVMQNYSLLTNSISLPSRLTIHSGLFRKGSLNSLGNSIETSIRYDHQDFFSTLAIRPGYYFSRNFALGYSLRWTFYQNEAIKNSKRHIADARFILNNGLKIITSCGVNWSGSESNIQGMGMTYEIGLIFSPIGKFCSPFDLFTKGGGVLAGGTSKAGSGKTRAHRGRIDCPLFQKDKVLPGDF